MRKDIASGFVFLLIVLISACAGRRALYSPFTLRLIQKVEKAEQLSDGQNVIFNLTDSDCKRFLITKTNNNYTVNGIIIVNDAFTVSQIVPLKIKIRSRRQNVLHAVIPVSKLQELGKIPHILRIEIDTPVKKK